MAGKRFMSMQASSKISKQNNHKSNEKQLNTFIKVLQPKAYITASSNFRCLVQELTGNGCGSSMPFPASPGRTEAVLIENNAPVIDIIEDYGDNEEASMETYSFDASVDSFEFSHSIEDDQMYLNDATFDIWSMNQLGENWLANQDIESWLLDVDLPLS